MTSLLALLSSLLWGTSDFLGGRLSRRASSIWVVAASQACSLGVLTVAAAGAFAFGMRAHGAGWLPWGVGGGLSLSVALVSFYRGLAVGRMGIVAPIASTGVIVPVAVGLLEGDRPAALQAVGVAVAVVGVLLASRPAAHVDGESGGRAAVGLALLAGLGFGTALVCLHSGAASNGLDTLWAMRLVIVTVLAVPAWRARPAAVDGGTWRTLVALGVCDVSSNAAFALASISGELALVAVLSSFYPVVTTLLARELLHERLSHSQLVGVVATVAGTVLIVV
jgi:drug/metabolite transporter (DMT)-like permease